MTHKVAIITGASSGIGEATAYRLADEGINLVLGARRISILEEVAERCREKGVKVVALDTNVTNEDDVDRLAQAAVDHFGSFDIWINNAGVSLLGKFSDIPSDMFKQVMDTNFNGCVYGSRSAISEFLAREQGTLINVASVFGTVPSPLESPYVASKFAMRGFTASLRQEMHMSGMKDVHVCTVLPASINTPIYRNAANLSGHQVKPPAPIYDVSVVVDAIVELLRHPRAEVIAGGSGKVLAACRALLPADLFEKVFARYIEFSHFKGKEAPHSPGNLFNPGEMSGVSGKWRVSTPRQRAAYAAAGTAAVAGLAWMVARKLRQRRQS
jgi:short-subunit dehydrogenase